MAFEFFNQSYKNLRAYSNNRYLSSVFGLNDSWILLFKKSVEVLKSEVNANNLYPALIIHIALHKIITYNEIDTIGQYIGERADYDWDVETWKRSLENQLSAAFDSRRKFH